MQLVKYDIETAVITALDAKYRGVQITDGKSYAFVMEGLRDYRELRLKIDAKHKELKADALEYGRAVDAEKNRLKGLLAPGEEHLKVVRQAEDDRKEAIRLENERIEQDRVNGIREKIFGFQKVAGQLGGKSSVELQQIISGIMDIAIDESYMEFAEEAKRAKSDVMTAIEDAYDARIKWEREEAERKIEIEKLAKEKAEQEEKEKILTEERRKIEEERAKFQTEKKAEQERKDREEFERKAKEEAKAQAEKEAAENARQKAEEAEALAAVKAIETARQEALKPDKEKLLAFAENLLELTGPVVKDKKAKVILADAIDGLSHVSATIKTEVEDL